MLTSQQSFLQIRMSSRSKSWQHGWMAVLTVSELREVFFRQAMSGHPQAMQEASDKLRELYMLLSAFVIGNSSMFTIARTIRPQVEPSAAQLMSAAVCLNPHPTRQLLIARQSGGTNRLHLKPSQMSNDCGSPIWS